jgi:hypothetical protein
LEGNLRRGAPGKRPKVGAPAGRKEIEEGVLGKTTIFLLSTQTEQRRGAGEGATLARAAGGPPGHDGCREWGERREEVEGNSFQSSHQDGTACGGRSTAAGGLQAEAVLMRRWELGERGEWLGGARHHGG